MARRLSDDQLERKIARLGPTRQKVDLIIELGARTYYARIDRARTLFSQALELAERLRYPAGEALAHQWLGAWHGRSDEWRESLEHAVKALGIFRALRDAAGEGAALRIIGEARIAEGSLEEAGRALDASLDALHRAGDLEGSVMTHAAIGQLRRAEGRLDAARAAYERSRELCVSLGNDHQLAYVMNNLAVIESESGNYAAALTMLERLVPIRERNEDVSGMIETLSNIGNQYAFIADYESALGYMLRALRMREELGVGRRDIALNNIAFVCSKLGRLEEAGRYYREALAIAESIGAHADVGDYHGGLASIHSKLGEIEQATEHAERSIAIARELGRDASATIGYANLAAALRRAGELDAALGAINEAVSRARSGSPPLHLAEHLRALAEIELSRGDVEAAMAAADESRAIMERTGGGTSMPELYGLLSELHERRGELGAALAMSRRRFEAYSSSIEQQSMHRLQALTVQFSVERLRRDAEIATLRAQSTERDLEMKQKELSLMALHLVNKNEFLMDLRRQIGEDVANTNEFVRALARRIDEGLTSDRDWAEFEQSFAQTNPDFAARLLEASGGRLSPTEIKVCTLLRTGLSTKEIAGILHVSTRTIDSHRYNIHRKLGLGEQRLVSYLTSLG